MADRFFVFFQELFYNQLMYVTHLIKIDNNYFMETMYAHFVSEKCNISYFKIKLNISK